MNHHEQDTRYDDMQQFALPISHELRNSITRIKLAISLIENEVMSEKVAKYVGVIQRASVRLENNMQSLTEIILMPLISEPAPVVSPAKVLEEVLQECAVSIASIGAQIEKDIEGVGEMHYVRSYLKIIFANVIGNAIKFRDTSRPLHLSITAQRFDDGVQFSFSDNGSGIDLHKHGHRLFEPFTRLEPTIDGSGMGLYVIKGITERNGGHVAVASTPGVGSKFRFFLKEYL
jgi:signal transduction histidine kinase